MEREFKAADVAAAARRAAAALKANHALLTELDQAVGDGDLGVTAIKLAEALEAAADQGGADLGKFLAQTGMSLNRAASSTMGTLMATALMQAGKRVMGKESLTTADLPELLNAATEGVRTRGKANLGDKTLLDALAPAADAFAAALAEGKTLPDAAQAMVGAARGGRDRVTPLRNRIGRASWLGERTEGKVDPGCVFAVIVLAALAGDQSSEAAVAGLP
jgi:phosphoenolpyruvate---glycerone phosphotransferase subunit DhaL